MLTFSLSSFRHFYLASTFHSITCLGRYFLRKMWPIQLAFLPFIFCRIFLSSLTLCNTGLLHLSPKPRLETFQVYLFYIPKCPVLNIIKNINQIYHFSTFFLKFNWNFLMKRTFFLLTAGFAMAILDIISRLHIASCVILLPE